MSSFYYLFMAMEWRIRKGDLHLGFMDSDYYIYRYVLRQIDEYFSQDIFERTEHLDSFVYSIRKEMSATPLLELRSKIYELMGIMFTHEEDSKEEELRERLEGVDIGRMATVSQYCFFDIDERYPFFFWRRCRQKQDVQWTQGSVTRPLPVDSHGIQLYYSQELFESELGGELHLLTASLQSALRGEPYAKIISVEIQNTEDVKDIL